MSSSYPEISVVIPVLNEVENIAPLISKLKADLRDLAYEAIFVDDGSTDGTQRKITECANGAPIRLVQLRKNYGQSTAMTAGIDYSRGKYVVLMDGDLQNDSSDIPKMLKVLKQGDWDVVAGHRANRQDGLLIRKIPSNIANYFIRKSTGVHIKDYGCTLKIFKKEIADDLGIYGEMHRFIPVLASMQGARITQIPVNHHPRTLGKSKYGLGRTVKVIADLFTMVLFRKYIQKPMHLFGSLGLLLVVAGIGINVYLLALKLAGENLWGKPLLILGVILLLGGIQLITIGFLAEINIRTYFEAGNKKTYQIRRIFNGEKRQLEHS